MEKTTYKNFVIFIFLHSLMWWWIESCWIGSC